MDIETFFSESLRTEIRFDVLDNGSILVEIRYLGGGVLLHEISKDEAIVLMEWMTRATM